MEQSHAERKKSRLNDKEKRMASHVEESERDQGRSQKRASAIGWATAQKHANKRKGEGEESHEKSSVKKSKSSHGKRLH